MKYIRRLTKPMFLSLSHFKMDELQLPELPSQQPPRLAGEFWGLESTHLKAAEIEKH